MPKTDFYNWNRNRAYPLVERPAYTFDGIPLEESVLLDAGFVLGLDEAFDPEHVVVLYAIGRRAGYVDFYFRGTTAIGSFVFECAVGSPGLYSTTSTLGSERGGEAFLVVDELQELYDSLPAGVRLADAEYPVEPGLVQYLENAYVRALNIASEKDDPGTSMCALDPSARWDFAVTGLNLRGNLVFKPGHNAYVQTDYFNNTIEIGAGVGRGEGEPCGRPLLEDCDGSSSSAIAVDPVLTCADGINTINGVPPSEAGTFRLLGGQGVEVIPVPDEHKIIIRFLTGQYDRAFCNGGDA